MIQLQERREPSSFSLFNLGFRPFFLAGALSAVILITLWLVIYSRGYQPNYYGLGIHWHAHEMLFGFSIAIIAGFLLTAVRTWTNVQTLYGWPLAALFALWLLARLLPAFESVPHMLIALTDLAFIPLVAVSIAWPIIKSQNYKNLLFVPILLSFFIANLLVHLELMGLTEGTLAKGIHLGLFLIIMVISIIGGRVIPFFTEKGVAGTQSTKYAFIERTIIPLTALWVISTLTHYTIVIAVLSAALGMMNLIRLWGWFSRKIFAVPLVWILQLSYLFVIIGYLFYPLSLLDLLNPSIAYHAFAVGGIGGLTLGMMSRVSLGHTGRPLAAGPMMITAFVLLMLSALLRISIDIMPLSYTGTLHLSGSLWIIAWLLFLIKYTSILIKPRVDGLYG
ncbi:NnrS family protein [Neptuniibacter pectenicola]|jgi:uncharacterized protein involved in response to NO|uniref:NnrS family protein n=1 Tax=Neptuniibacter pectenicola TaxID=1806669 RepID=UPI000831D6AE|nr:NnrS family protein [Neptuniibacter pectenicola]